MGSVNSVIALFSVAAFAAVLAVSLGIFWFDPSSKVAPLAAVSAFYFVIHGLARPAQAILARNMQFVPLSMMQVAGALTKVAVTIAGLAMGMSSLALILGVLAEPLWLICAAFLIDRKLAYCRPHFRQIRSVLDYCTKMTLSAFLNRGLVALVAPITGTLLNLAAAGQFNRANGLISQLRTLLLRAIGPVAVGSFAKTNRESRTALKQAYLRSFSMLSCCVGSAFGLVAVLSEPLILVVYGADWAPIAPYAQWLAIAGVLFSFSALGPEALAAIGAGNANLQRSFIVHIPTLLVVVFAAHFSLLWVCIALAISRLFEAFVTAAIMTRNLDIPPREFGSAASPAIIVIGLTVAGAFAAKHAFFTGVASNLFELIVVSLAGVAVWLASVYAFHRVLRSELELWKSRFFSSVFRQKAAK